MPPHAARSTQHPGFSQGVSGIRKVQARTEARPPPDSSFDKWLVYCVVCTLHCAVKTGSPVPRNSEWSTSGGYSAVFSTQHSVSGTWHIDFAAPDPIDGLTPDHHPLGWTYAYDTLRGLGGESVCIAASHSAFFALLSREDWGVATSCNSHRTACCFCAPGARRGVYRHGVAGIQVASRASLFCRS